MTLNGGCLWPLDKETAEVISLMIGTVVHRGDYFIIHLVSTLAADYSTGLELLRNVIMFYLFSTKRIFPALCRTKLLPATHVLVDKWIC